MNNNTIRSRQQLRQIAAIFADLTIYEIAQDYTHSGTKEALKTRAPFLSEAEAEEYSILFEYLSRNAVDKIEGLKTQ
jgi:hypothetical protein